LISFFLGAGASAPFGYPVTEKFKTDLVEELETKFTTEGDLPEEEKILFTILKYKTYKDIEYVFDFWEKLMRLKKDKEYSALVDFLISNIFHVEFEKIYGTGHSQAASLDRYFHHNETLMDFLVRKLYQNYSWKSENFEKAKIIYSSLTDLAKKQQKIDIFTTNYDTVIEEYCKENRELYNMIDGFKYDAVSECIKWNPTLFDEENNSEKQKIFLYKLHGSLNWKHHMKYGIVKLIDIEMATKAGGQYTHDVLIKPTLYPKQEHNIEPFRTLISKFGENLKKNEFCIIIGYSFRDENINDVFYEFLKQSKKLIIISNNATLDFNQNFMSKYDMNNINNYILLDEKITSSAEKMNKLKERITSML